MDEEQLVPYTAERRIILRDDPRGLHVLLDEEMQQLTVLSAKEQNQHAVRLQFSNIY